MKRREYQPPLQTASEFFNHYQSNRDSIIVEKLEDEYTSLIKSLDLPSVSATKKINSLNKVLLKSIEIAPKLKNSAILSNFENKIKMNINNIQFNSLLEEAQKAEFKSNKKGALGKYYELFTSYSMISSMIHTKMNKS